MSYLVDFTFGYEHNVAKFGHKENAEAFAKGVANSGGKAIIYPFDPYSKEKQCFGYNS